MFGKWREGSFGCVFAEESFLWELFGGKIGIFLLEESLFRGNLGAFLEEKSGLFCSKNSLAWADFKGVGGVIKAPFCEANPPESDEIGAAFEGMDG